jgi:hypothetical protein
MSLPFVPDGGGGGAGGSGVWRKVLILFLGLKKHYDLNDDIDDDVPGGTVYRPQLVSNDYNDDDDNDDENDDDDIMSHGMSKSLTTYRYDALIYDDNDVHDRMRSAISKHDDNDDDVSNDVDDDDDDDDDSNDDDDDEDDNGDIDGGDTDDQDGNRQKLKESKSKASDSGAKGKSRCRANVELDKIIMQV